MGYISHIDFRVKDAALVLPFYDALFEALGFGRAVPRSAIATYARWDSDGVRDEWFNLYEDPTCVASATRLAFRAQSREIVDQVHRAVREHANNIDGPEDLPRVDPSYYGLFFEDALGNKFETCHCALRR